MDAAAISVKRAANLARHGDSNGKEALGLQLILHKLQEDGRLECHKSFEKARVDFCIYPKSKPGAPALGIQLKTTGGNWVQSQTGNQYYHFNSTDGYTGLLIVLVALHERPPRIWFADGSRVVAKCLRIPVVIRQGMKSDRVREVGIATLADTMCEIYAAAGSGSSNYMLRSPSDHEKPTERNALAEYNAFKRLQRSLPVLFIDPPAEHMSYDMLVDGKTWQIKLATYRKKSDDYSVTCFKNAGIVGGKRTIKQYEVDDFDFLCIQLPENAIDCCYLIPQGILAGHGLLGTAKSCAAVRVFPHRPVTARYAVHNQGVHWTENFRINFADDPLAQLARITRGADQKSGVGGQSVADMSNVWFDNAYF